MCVKIIKKWQKRKKSGIIEGIYSKIVDYLLLFIWFVQTLCYFGSKSCVIISTFEKKKVKMKSFKHLFPK